MNNKKKMVLGAAFVVAIMALAGIGYAAVTSYNGTTSSKEQTVDVDYVVVKLGNEGYLPGAEISLVYNTETEATVTAGEVTAITTTYNYVESTELTYNIIGESDTIVEENNVVLKLNAAEAFDESGFILEVKYGTGNWTKVSGTGDVQLSDDKDTILDTTAFSVRVNIDEENPLSAGVAPPETIDIPAFTFTIEVTYPTS